MSEQQKRKGKFYSFATVGALTERGGRVTSGGGGAIGGLAIATVGSIVTYSGGSEAIVIDGAGAAAVQGNQPMAIIGSRLSNGDRIISTPWEELKHGIFVEEGETIPGLFDPDWTPPPREPVARFAVRGATTARGGVLNTATSEWEVAGTHSKAGKIGDFIEYADGTRARIITGIGMPGNIRYAFAVVGSLLDNGDVINDSPHREVQTATSFVPVDEHLNALATH